MRGREITLEHIRLIFLLNDPQILVCRRLEIYTMDGIIDLLNIEVNDDHVLSYQSLSEEEQTCSNLRFVLSLDIAYTRAFLSLPLRERSLETLQIISLYRYEIIEIFLNFSEDERNISLLNKIAELSEERIELLEQVWDINVAGFNVVATEFTDGDVEFCLSLSECNLDTLKLVKELSSRKRQMVLALEKQYRVIRFVDSVSRLSENQVDIWFALDSAHHTALNFMQLDGVTEEQIALCKHPDRPRWRIVY